MHRWHSCGPPRRWRHPPPPPPLHDRVDARIAHVHARRSLSLVAQHPPAPHADKPRVLVIAGPTGVGKTRLSLDLAQRLGGEIVSCDSVQVYRGMDIGSNKVDAASRARCPHHMLDVADVSHALTVGDYCRMASRCIDDIVQRGRVPIVVGGSMLYLRWLLYGPAQVPRDIPTHIQHMVRRVCDAAVAAATAVTTTAATTTAAATTTTTPPASIWHHHVRSDDELSRALDAVTRDSPETAAFVDHVLSSACSQRIERALSIVLHTGRAPPAYHVPERAELATSPALRYDARCVHLSADRTWLSRIIDWRSELMLRDGLLDETHTLTRRHALLESKQCTAIGYRQAIEFLQQHVGGGGSSGGGVDAQQGGTSSLSMAAQQQQRVRRAFADSLVPRLCAANRQYVRRQLIWFRSEPIYRFVHVPTPHVPVAARDLPDRIEDLMPPDSAWRDTADHVQRWYEMDSQTYWAQMSHDPAVIEEQEHLREGTKSAARAKERLLYVPRPYVFTSDAAIQATLDRLYAHMRGS